MHGTGLGAADRRAERRFLLVLVLGGVVLRLLWFARTHEGLGSFAAAGEATRVALSLARDGRFADAFGVGSGPTAHMMPVMPLVAGAIHRMFGDRAGALLLAWSLLQSITATLLVREVFARLGVAPATLRWGAVLAFLLPVYVPQETVDFRYWEGAASVCLATANLLAALAVARFRTLPLGGSIAAALLWSLTAFTNPVAGVATAIVWGWVALRHLSLRTAVTFAAGAALAAAMLFAPWTIRNARDLGEPIVTRSNFGLEFAIGNLPPGIATASPEQGYADRLAAIHPLHTPAARAAMIAAGGEVAYAHRLGARTMHWAWTNQAAFVATAARHLSQFYCPRPWQMYFTGWDDLRSARSWIVSAAALLGLAGLLTGVLARRPGYDLVLIYVVTVSLPYALVQPIPRYGYLVWALLLFAGVDAIVRVKRYRPGALKAK